MAESRNRYLAKNTTIFAIGNMATKLITFFLVPIYTNALSTSQYGTVDLISTICTVLAPIFILNISESVMRFALDKGSDHKKIMSAGIALFIFAFIIGLLIFPVCSLFESISEYTIYIYLYTLVSAGCQLFLSCLRGKEMLVRYAIGNVIHTFTIAAFNIVFLLYLNFGIDGYFIAYILSALITMIYSFLAGGIWRDIIPLCLDKQLLKQMLKFSIVLIPNTFMWWIMNSSDRIMVSSMIGIAANGIYAVSYKIPSFVSSTTTIFNQAWSYSAIREEDEEDKVKYTNTVFLNYSCFVFLLGITILSFIKPFTKIYVTTEYYDSWKYMPFLTIGCVFLTLASFMATSYTVHKDSLGYLLSGMFGAVLNIILNFVLIPFIGVYGAAIATCVSYISVFLFRYFHTKKYLRYDIKHKEFFLGVILLLLVSLLNYIENPYIIVLQTVIFIISLIYFSKVWLPVAKKIFKIFIPKTKNKKD